MTNVVEDAEKIQKLLESNDVDPVDVSARDEVGFMNRTYEGIVVEISSPFNSDEIEVVYNLIRLGGYEPILDFRNDDTGNAFVKGLLKDSERKPVDEFPASS